MAVKQVYKNDQFKVINLALSKGEVLPEHKTKSEALLIVTKGKGKISFIQKEQELEQGTTFVIPANELHKVEALEDFTASIILSN
jgi:quercetin dioxygenase-like cupin family protein